MSSARLTGRRRTKRRTLDQKKRPICKYCQRSMQGWDGLERHIERVHWSEHLLDIRRATELARAG